MTWSVKIKDATSPTQSHQPPAYWTVKTPGGSPWRTRLDLGGANKLIIAVLFAMLRSQRCKSVYNYCVLLGCCAWIEASDFGDALQSLVLKHVCICRPSAWGGVSESVWLA